MAKTDISAQRLRDIVSYDPLTGLFRWLVTRVGRAKAGAPAGYNRKDRYVIIGVDGRPYLGHRLAWLHHYGEWPELDLDHIDGNPNNNRISNLRQVSHAQNMRNKHRATRRSTTKHLGVKKIDDHHWDVCLMVDGRVIRATNLPSAEIASSIYKLAKAEVERYLACKTSA